ncbi:MAG TPA: bifunctional diaminohydroxyphosphoribosylaminopyrimidine deaminase/5-amino-6-(5-phosphoribosylamino)uracil reductase RibD [Gemmatimonadaceae bacterium]|nr:bifunctional diaminohydroxyphosphoribosylaminopyrimidine deaminase/5-amino-6-(5-phosphoribosylamino)uracil reductase RibD [Gemmatimonadaceae bacterium]
MDDRSADARDRALMRRALALARRGWGQTAPNPMVGAVVVQGDEVVGEGYHARFGGDHAEVAALRGAGARARGATVYVTLEPCAHFGKTPPCTDALIAARVSRVVIAARDPNPTAAGGTVRLQQAGIAVTEGIEERAARELNAPFFHAFPPTRPWITLKLAVSIDCAIADAQGRSRWITGTRSRREVHRLRAGHDAIAVGIGTVLADNPSLTVRESRAPRVPPYRVVFDRTARIPLDATLVRTAREVPTIVVTESAALDRMAALEHAGVQVIRSHSLEDALAQLRAREIRSLLVEGGARLAGALLTHDAVDRMIIFQAPVLLGAGALHAFAFAPSMGLSDQSRLPILTQRRLGEDTMTVYAVRDSGLGTRDSGPASGTGAHSPRAVPSPESRVPSP